MSLNLKIKEGSENYAATIVEIDNIHPIKDADLIVRTVVFGNDVIVNKDTQIGTKMIYFVSGTKLNPDFCKFNNLLTDKEQNRDQTKTGYISHKQFRVKAVKLRGVISDGILLPLNSLSFNHDAWDSDLNIGDAFTDINDISICEKYIVPIARNSNPGGKSPKIARFNRILDNQFHFHNDTSNLRKNMHKLNPEDIIGIHYKKHGTSAVFANVLVKRQLSFLENILKFFGFLIQETYYDIVYSSRKVIKNQYLNPTSGGGFYGEDTWGTVAKEIGHLIPKNWTLYGEIVGYTPQNRAIQAKYDYGCKNGEHKFYVYKISVTNPDGKVIYLTDLQIKEWCDKVGLLYSDTLIYYGKANEIYNNLFDDYVQSYTDADLLTYEESQQNPEHIDQFRIAFLRYLEQNYNEKDCYMCANKVPEEGIVLRIEHLEEYEAYKLKSKRFTLMESELQEQEEINIEDEQGDSL